MKNLNILFDLLLFPFLYIKQLSSYLNINRNWKQKKLLFAFASFFIFLNLSSYAEDEPNNSCAQAAVILEYGTYYNSDSGSSSVDDLDFYYFDVPDNGELNVTIENTSTAKSLIYSSLSTACPSSAPSTLLKSTSTTITIPSTSAEKYYIYVEGVANSPATGYTISARFTPNTLSNGIDLKITKAGSIDTALIYEPFYYTINVNNIGEANASNVVITDTLPSGMSADLTATNAAPDDWTCSDSGGNTAGFSTGIITCSLDGNLTAASLSSIILHVKAPPTAGTSTNEVNVTSDGADIDTSNNTATETTEIINEIDTAENLCYTEYTELENHADYNATCEKKGNFYYGNTCKAYVAVTDVNITSNLSDIIIYKMYAPDVSSGACTYTTDGSDPTNAGRSCDNIDNATDFGGYHGGYAIEANTSINNVNDIDILINDIGTDNNPRVDGIAMFGDYWTASGFHHTGRIYACSGASEGGIEITTSADVIDTLINDEAMSTNYNGSFVPNPNPPPFDPTDGNIKYIQTMVAADTAREIVGVHLDLAGLSLPYVYLGSQNPADMPYSIIPLLTDDACSEGISENIIDPITGEDLVIDIPPGAYSAIGTMIVSDIVRKNARIKMSFVDPNTLSPEGQQCLANSSTTGNFARLAQCTNSEIQYKTAFGQDAWDRCGDGNGNPCLSANHGYSCGENDTTCVDYNPIYDNELGCYMCTFNLRPACSTDNFAIRPERLDVSMPDPANPSNLHPDAPNLLRAGQGYGISLTAKNMNIDPVTGIDTSLTYNVVDASIFETNTTKYFKSNWTVIAPDDKMHGDSDVSEIGNSSIISGLSHDAANSDVDPDPILNISYDDIGEVTFYIYDKDWAEVDNDDTPQDCNSSTHTRICGEQNLTFIPHHFGFEELNITNHAGSVSDFTYVANKRGMPENGTLPIRSPMASRIHTQIRALTQDGNITQNFRKDFGGNLYYENNITVTQNVEMPTVRTGTEPNAYIFGSGNDVNESKIDNKLVGFGRTTGAETDDPGTRNIKWNESTYPLEFNFKREMQKGENPFDVNGSYFSIDVESEYTDASTPSSPQTIEGSRIGDKNTSTCINPPTGSCVNSNALGKATFYYGRVRSSQFFYEGGMTSVNTDISINVYCDLGFSVCNDFGINTSQGQTAEYEWWLSWRHDTTRDGNVTLVVGNPLLKGSGSPTINTKPNPNHADISIAAAGVNTNVIVAAGANPILPMIVPIELVNNIETTPAYSYTTTPPYTNQWLIYNKDTDSLSQALPSPFFKVEFIGVSGWAGHGDTGHVVDGDASTKKNRRLGW